MRPGTPGAAILRRGVGDPAPPTLPVIMEDWVSGMTAVQHFQHFLTHHWVDLLVPLGVLALTLMLGYAAKRLLLRGLRDWAARSRSQVPRIVTDALAGPFMIWVLILGAHFAMQSSDLPHSATVWVSRVLLILWILSITMMGSRLVGNVIRLHGTGVPGALPVTTLTETLARLGVMILGLVVLLNQLGISITPILTALGVGGLAIALALQDTLANLFAGFYVAVARQVRLGDYIRLDSNEEGYVSDIGWRSTTINTVTNNTILIPNNKLGQAIVTNYHLPDKRMRTSVSVGVSYDADPDLVERLLLEAAADTAREVPGMVADPAAIVRFEPGFGDSALEFTLLVYVEEFRDQYAVRHELRKRILKSLRREGIEIPFPIRTVYMRGAGTS
jgi:small-conductance mechanosensitive channel